MQALISVSKKDGVVDLARGLAALGWNIFSTGGTEKAIREAGVAVKSVSEKTGFPEIMDGRVKTLPPQVHGGILARRNVPGDMAQAKQHGISTIDLVAVNLYPFREAVADPSIPFHDALEQIDIGGPSLLRAAAKNHPFVLVLVDPADYGPVLDMLKKGDVPQEERRRLAQKAFQHVASYDTVIAQYLAGPQKPVQSEADLPQGITLSLEKAQELRYGENPHQHAALYREVRPGVKDSGILAAKQLGGRELSFNNMLDANAAWNIVSAFTEPTVAVIKHNNPCGLSSHADITEAYKRAFEGDTISAFGGIVSLNRPLDAKTANAMADVFYEIVIAPGFSPEALAILQKKKNLRILDMAGQRPDMATLDYRRIEGGFLVQSRDVEPATEWKTVTKRQPTAKELEDLRFAWTAVRFIKSNAIVLVKDKTLVGMGAGQPNRVVSVRLSLEKAGEKARGSVVASDAFFPFPDNVETAAQGGITAIVQPGGSIRDEESIKAADAANLAMLVTGIRHFLH